MGDDGCDRTGGAGFIKPSARLLGCLIHFFACTSRERKNFVPIRNGLDYDACDTCARSEERQNADKVAECPKIFWLVLQESVSYISLLIASYSSFFFSWNLEII